MGDSGGMNSGGSGKGRKRKRVCWAEAELLEEVSCTWREPLGHLLLDLLERVRPHRRLACMVLDLKMMFLLSMCTVRHSKAPYDVKLYGDV